MRKLLLLICLISLHLVMYSQQWNLLGLEHEKIQEIAVHPSHSDTIYAVGNHLYKSMDGGITWDTVSAYAFHSVAFDPNPDTMYATFAEGSYSDGIYTSTNGGTDWRPLKYMYKPVSITISEDPPGNIYVGSADVYESPDHGTTWNELSDSLKDLDVHSLTHLTLDSGIRLIAGTEDGIYYYTRDSNAYWKQSANLKNAKVRVMASDILQNRLWGAMTGLGKSSGIYTSHDGGVTWQLSEYLYDIADIIVNPHNGNTVYVADTNTGVRATHNAGINWQLLNDGINNAYCIAQTPSDTTRLYAGTASGIYVLKLTTSSTSRIQKNSTINVYPSPSSGKFTLTTPKPARVSICDMHGNRIRGFNMRSTQHTVNLQGLESGLYVIRIDMKDSVVFRKWIKE